MSQPKPEKWQKTIKFKFTVVKKWFITINKRWSNEKSAHSAVICVGYNPLVLGYLGLVPGLSSIMGATKAKDLGVRYTEADLKSYVQKSGCNWGWYWSTGNPRTDLVFEGSHHVTSHTTSEELTARMNNLESFAYNPMTNQQVLIHEDGTGEISGNMRLSGIAGRRPFNRDSWRWGKDHRKSGWGRKIPDTQSCLLCQGSLKVVNNQIEMDVSEVKFNRLNIPISNLQRDYRPGSWWRLIWWDPSWWRWELFWENNRKNPWSWCQKPWIQGWPDVLWWFNPRQNKESDGLEGYSAGIHLEMPTPD